MLAFITLTSVHRSVNAAVINSNFATSSAVTSTSALCTEDVVLVCCRLASRRTSSKVCGQWVLIAHPTALSRPFKAIWTIIFCPKSCLKASFF